MADKGPYVQLFSLHGLIRSKNLEWEGMRIPAGRSNMSWNWAPP
jgi:hypothetical protein